MQWSFVYFFYIPDLLINSVQQRIPIYLWKSVLPAKRCLLGVAATESPEDASQSASGAARSRLVNKEYIRL